MQNVDDILKTYCVNSPPRIAVMGSHNFENASAAKSLEWLGCWIDSALLGSKEGVSDIDPYWARE